MTRGISYLWILATIGINVVAFAGLLYQLGVSQPAWYGPFLPISDLYDQGVQIAFGVMADWAKNAVSLELPRWFIHVLVLYGSTASAIAASGMGVTRRESFVEGLKSAGVSMSWPLVVPAFLWDAIRYRLVARFARDHALAFCFYGASVVATYIGARWVNDAYFAPAAEPVVEPAAQLFRALTG